jgi:hypothetical protein
MSVDAIAARKASHNPDEEMEMADFAVVTRVQAQGLSLMSWHRSETDRQGRAGDDSHTNFADPQATT